MEQGRKIQKAMGLYQQRLDNLPKILTQLYEIVKGDEVLSHLKDPVMEKYKVDRVNEIVLEVINSQKEKMLIRVLQKYQELSAKLKQKQQKPISVKQSSYYDNWLDLKQKSKKELSKLNSVLEQKNETINKLNKEIGLLRQALREKEPEPVLIKAIEPCLSCQRFKLQLVSIENERKLATQVVEKLKKDGQSAIQMLNQKIRQLEQDLQRKATTKRIEEDPGLKNQNAKRTQKIEVMRRQIAFLEEELIQVQKQFNTIKDVTMTFVVNEMKKLKNHHKKFKESIASNLRSLQNENKTMVQKMANRLLEQCSKPSDGLKPQKLLWKLNSLENQLDYFLENEIVVE